MERRIDEDGNTIITLCGVQGCCPTVKISLDGNVEITDDHGGKVNLSAAEFAELQQAGSAAANVEV
ncbi:hypothetical protein HY626_00500 [Candidatus Uhrbacteria bacterium]|nr:hypothetical protein [Candidatus Uhrbacteria bacterium]